MAASVGDQQVGPSGASRSPTRPHEVFVSYSSRDKPVADAIVARLENAGIRCWFAPRDVLPGMNWAQAIVEAIGSTRLMVVVLSGEANRSHQVLREVERAISTGVVVIPFRIEAVEPTDAMAYYLASEHWLDALTPPLDDHIATLAQVVEAFLERTPEPAAPGPAAFELDASLNRVYPDPAVGGPGALVGRRRWLLLAGGILAVAGVIGAVVMLPSRAGPDPTGRADPTAVAGTADEPVTDQPAGSDADNAPGDDILTDPQDLGATQEDGGSDVEDGGSQALLDRLFNECAEGARASCSRLWWFDAEGHPYAAGFGDFPTSQLWRLSAVERWGIDIPDGPLPMSYGSHAVLDQLYEECDAGEGAACTELLWESPLHSEYQERASRSFDHRPSSDDVSNLKAWWLVLNPMERTVECDDFGRNPAGLVASWDGAASNDTVLQFYSDHCGDERELE
jgi:hypothetical protein